MRNSGFKDQLNHAVDELLAGGKLPAATDHDSLLAIAQELARSPRPAFKNWLRQDLLGGTADDGHQPGEISELTLKEILPSLGSQPWGMFPADHKSFLFSFTSHLVLVLLIASGIWVGARPGSKKPLTSAKLIFPVPGSGGGGSGDRSPLAASQGSPPQFSRQPWVPPLVVIENRRSQLIVPSATLAPPTSIYPRPSPRET